MIPTFVPKRFALPWLVAATGLLLVPVAPALGATSSQQVYAAPEAGLTPSPLPNLPPAGEVQLPAPFTPQALQGPGPAGPGPLVAGSGAPVPTSTPCVPSDGVGPPTGSGSAVGAEECAPAPGDGTAVGTPVTPGPAGMTPVGEVASAPGPAAAAGSSGTLPVTGLDLFVVLAAAAAAAGVGFSLRRAAVR